MEHWKDKCQSDADLMDWETDFPFPNMWELVWPCEHQRNFWVKIFDIKKKKHLNDTQIIFVLSASYIKVTLIIKSVQDIWVIIIVLTSI